MRGAAIGMPAAAGALVIACVTVAAQAPPQRPDGFRFKAGIDLINVTATVTDATGRFVRDLTVDDFVLYDDGEQQTIAHFDRERVPVSLGIVLDTSGSMVGDKIASAQQAIQRFMGELLDPEDEIFLVRFADDVDVVQEWTQDRSRLERGVRRITPAGGTALYDAVATSIPIADQGHHQKKALVIISDGNDTSSTTSVADVRSDIRHSDVLVYAIGIDAAGEQTFNRQPRIPPQFPPPTYPFPIPRGQPNFPRWPPRTPQQPRSWTRGSERVNVEALRSLTDDSGGRTEIIRSARDLGPATAGIADELSRQYYLGYTSTRPRDGRWHEIDLVVRGERGYVVRARSGYLATP